MKYILGKKLAMSQIFDKKGNVVPLTWIEVGPCFVIQIKTKASDGYDALQIGFLKKKNKKIKKTEKGKGYRYLREGRGLRINDKELNIGDKIDVSILSEGDIVRISGISKAKGFQGVVKRWGFKGAPKSHGTQHQLRKPGSIGQSDVERVFKGTKMAGRMGGKKVSIKNLKIIKIDKEKNLMGVKGAVPGRKGTLLEIRG